jgi:hypothetical protein
MVDMRDGDKYTFARENNRSSKQTNRTAAAAVCTPIPLNTHRGQGCQLLLRPQTGKREKTVRRRGGRAGRRAGASREVDGEKG